MNIVTDCTLWVYFTTRFVHSRSRVDLDSIMRDLALGPTFRANWLYIVTWNNAVVQSRIVLVLIWHVPKWLFSELGMFEVNMYRIEYVPQWRVPKWSCPKTSVAHCTEQWRLVTDSNELNFVNMPVAKLYSHLKVFNVNKVAIGYGIVLIPLVYFPFRCTLSLYCQCVYVHIVKSCPQRTEWIEDLIPTHFHFHPNKQPNGSVVSRDLLKFIYIRGSLTKPVTCWQISKWFFFIFENVNDLALKCKKNYGTAPKIGKVMKHCVQKGWKSKNGENSC